MSKKVRFVLTSSLLCLALAGCMAGSRYKTLNALCADIGLPEPEIVSDADEHGGMGNDGTRLIVARFSEGPDSELAEASERWRPLPLNWTTEALVYGAERTRQEPYGVVSESIGPYILYPDGMEPIPRIENGYYYFLDRFGTDGSAGGHPFFGRGAYNFTVALFDADTNTLYYCEVDT